MNIIVTLLALLPFTLGAPTSPASPLVKRHGCTDTSFGDFAWELKEFDYHAAWVFTTPAHQNSWGYVNFTLVNPTRAPSVAVCSATSNVLSHFFFGNMKYTCSVPDGAPGNPGSGGGAVDWYFSVPTKVFNFNQSWTCADTSPDRPITFNAWANVTLPLECETTTWINPNWTMGQFYSDTRTTCKKLDMTIRPYYFTAFG